MLRFTEEKIFTQKQVQDLFLSVHWISGNYPERLYKALMHSSMVLTVWDDEKHGFSVMENGAAIQICNFL